MTVTLCALALLSGALFCAAPASAEESSSATPSVAPTSVAPAAAAPVGKQRIEVTFGSAQLFNHQSISTEDHRVEEQIIPVTSALFMLEWLLHGRISVLTMFNLPLTTQKTVVDGESHEEFVAPSIALGLRVSALRFDVFAASRLELQLAGLTGFTIGSASGDQVFPLAAGRLHFSTCAGFALYLGGAFAFRRETVGILYGIGHRF